jgi:hypothetical protein
MTPDLPSPIIPWLETLGAILLAAIGVVLGRLCSRLPGRWWMIGYFFPLVLVVLMGLPNWIDQMLFIPPSSWLTAGRTEYVLAGIIATWLLTTPLSRLPRLETRRLVVALMVTVVFTSSVMAFLAPALIRNQMLALKTRIDKDGVCLQSNGYNCGPASAVTALRRLGLPAEEGQLAILAHTSPISGTPPDILAETLQQRYQKDGLAGEFRFFKKVSDLKGAGEVLAIIKFTFFINHYVAVLEVTDKEITVGDPLNGRATYSHEEFAKKWLHCGVVLTRKK